MFTRDLGLVGAHAQNTRSINSKLRYALDAPARAVVSLIRGKHMWRLANAVPDKGFYSLWRESPEKQKLCTRTFSLLKKLLAGEDPNPELFTTVDTFLTFLEGNDFSHADDIKNIEAIIVLRILYLLGYVPENEALKQFFETKEWDVEIINAMSDHRKEAIKVINESLKETGL